MDTDLCSSLQLVTITLILTESHGDSRPANPCESIVVSFFCLFCFFVVFVYCFFVSLAFFPPVRRKLLGLRLLFLFIFSANSESSNIYFSSFLVDHCLNSNSAPGVCGVSQGGTDYNAWLDSVGNPIPWMTQRTYVTGEVIEVHSHLASVSLTRGKKDFFLLPHLRCVHNDDNNKNKPIHW